MRYSYLGRFPRTRRRVDPRSRRGRASRCSAPTAVASRRCSRSSTVWSFADSRFVLGASAPRSPRITSRTSSSPARSGAGSGFIFQNSDAQVFSPTVRDELAFGPLNMGLDVRRGRRRGSRTRSRCSTSSPLGRPRAVPAVRRREEAGGHRVGPRDEARRCCCSTSRPPPSIRGPSTGWSSSSSSCTRWGRRSSWPPTTSRRCRSSRTGASCWARTIASRADGPMPEPCSATSKPAPVGEPRPRALASPRWRRGAARAPARVRSPLRWSGPGLEAHAGGDPRRTAGGSPRPAGRC